MQASYTIVAESHPLERSVTLLLNGEFDEEALPDLAQTLAQARCSRENVLLDLSEVTLVDRKSVQYFSEQAAMNVKLVNCPIYLRHWIVGKP